MKHLLTASLLAFATAAAAAPPEREVCPALGGLDTGPCTTEPGHVTVELLPVDVTRDHGADAAEDRVELGHFLLRAGVTPSTELQAEWVPYGHVRTRERATGAVERRGRPGDATLAVRQNFIHPDGKGTSVAVQPFVTLPLGRRPVGAGTWGAGLVVPLSFDLSEKINLTFDPEVDAAVDEDGSGRHLAYGGVVSLSTDLTEALEVQLDYQSFRDRDPAGRQTTNRMAGTLTWQPAKTLAFYSTAAIALDHQTPDLEMFVGVARLF